MKRIIATLSLALLITTACSSARQFNAMSAGEKAEYIAFADRMTVDQRKVYLAKGTADARKDYLIEIGLYQEFLQKNAFSRLNTEMQSDFLKAYLNASPQQIQTYLASFDPDTRQRIKEKDLQHGWSGKQVVLALGKPADILEAHGDFGVNQLWIYPNQENVTYLYFQNGQLKNWAK